MGSDDVDAGSPGDLGDQGHRQPGAALRAHGVREPQPPPLRVCGKHPIGERQVGPREAPGHAAVDCVFFPCAIVHFISLFIKLFVGLHVWNLLTESS